MHFGCSYPFYGVDELPLIGDSYNQSRFETLQMWASIFTLDAICQSFSGWIGNDASGASDTSFKASRPSILKTNTPSDLSHGPQLRSVYHHFAMSTSTLYLVTRDTLNNESPLIVLSPRPKICLPALYPLNTHACILTVMPRPLSTRLLPQPSLLHHLTSNDSCRDHYVWPFPPLETYASQDPCLDLCVLRHPTSHVEVSVWRRFSERRTQNHQK